MEAFSRYAKEEISKLERQLQTGEYEPKALRRVYIEKAGSAEKMPLGIPAVRDRVVQGAVKQVLARLRGLDAKNVYFPPFIALEPAILQGGVLQKCL